MKKFLACSVAMLLASMQSESAVLTVDNSANSPGQYTGLQAAINAASPGDTIYISGSTASYGNVSVNKRLNLIGTGYNPAKQNPLVSVVQDINLDTVNSISGASGTYVAGLRLNTINASYGAKHITIERNFFNYNINLQAGSSDIVVRNCWFGQTINITNATNVLIEGNIFYQGYISSSNQPSVLINHNLFMNNIGSGAYCLNSISMATVQNNIFWGTSPLGTNVSNNTFSNNLTYQTPADNIPGGSNSGSGNLVAQNPMFVNVPSPGINFGYDYHVTNGSPAHNAGTDGTDLGIFGGPSVMPDLTGMPGIPQMIEMNIANPVIPPAGTLNVDFKARKND